MFFHWNVSDSKFLLRFPGFFKISWPILVALYTLVGFGSSSNLLFIESYFHVLVDSYSCHLHVPWLFRLSTICPGFWLSFIYNLQFNGKTKSNM